MYNCTIQNIKSSNSQNWLMTSPNTGLSRKLMNEKVDRKRRPASNGSASSAESFYTDQTCVQISPGIKTSPPTFNCQSKSKEVVKKDEEKNCDRTKNKSTSLVLNI